MQIPATLHTALHLIAVHFFLLLSGRWPIYKVSVMVREPGSYVKCTTHTSCTICPITESLNILRHFFAKKSKQLPIAT